MAKKARARTGEIFGRQTRQALVYFIGMAIILLLVVVVIILVRSRVAMPQ